MRLKVLVRYEAQDMAFDMPVGDGRMTIKWLGERAHPAKEATCAGYCFAWTTYILNAVEFDKCASIGAAHGHNPTHQCTNKEMIAALLGDVGRHA